MAGELDREPLDFGDLGIGAKAAGRPMILLRWIDSGGADGWVHLAGWQQKSMECWTLGWLLNETDQDFVVSGTIADGQGQDEQVQAPMAIPKIAVLWARVFDE